MGSKISKMSSPREKHTATNGQVKEKVNGHGNVKNNESKPVSEMDTFLSGLPPKNLEPLWSRMGAMVPPSPNPEAVPAIWKYEEMLPHLESAAKLVPEEQAERRVLMLVNPNMGK